MKILIGMGHPAHVHFFKNFIFNSLKKGHEITIVARDKEVTIDLLKQYHLKYELFAEHKKNLLGKILEIPYNDYIFYKITKKIQPDILLGINNYTSAHVGKLTGIPSIIFTDTEEAQLGNILTFPFTSTICTPSCFLKNLGEKQIRYRGYQELAYLHPNYFSPDPSILDEIGVSPKEKFIIVRFISWGAGHDLNLHGLKAGADLEFVKSLEQFGRVFITSERKLTDSLEKYRLKISPEKLHSLLYYASLYIGEGGTMATEAAILGTPSIHIEATSEGIASGTYVGNYLDLRDKYDLLYFYPHETPALKKAIEILEDPLSKEKWSLKRDHLMSDKIDVTAWMTEFIEDYPHSVQKYRSEHV